MKKLVLLGLSLFISANTVLADSLTQITDVNVPIPFADPLAEKKIVLDSEAANPLSMFTVELRPAAVIDIEEEKVEAVQIETSKEVTENDTDTVKEESTVKTEEISEDKQDVEPEKTDITEDDTEIKSEETTEEIEVEEQKTEEQANESDAIELNVGKGALFIPNTENKPETAKTEVYNIKPANEILDIRYDVDSAKVNGEFEPYVQYKKEEPSTDLKYKLNPNLSIKNIYPKSAEIKAPEPVMTVKPVEEEHIKEIKTDKILVPFSAGEPSHNQITPGKKIFRF